jgi:hypothetical protein
VGINGNLNFTKAKACNLLNPTQSKALKRFTEEPLQMIYEKGHFIKIQDTKK